MEEIIRKARKEDMPSLRSMWAECFPEDVKYSEFFFERIFKLQSAVVYEQNGECVGMIHVFPRRLCTPVGTLSAKYIYGVGTLKKCRGRGIAGRLLESEAHSCDALLLIPQSDSLFEFYKKCGFSEIAYVKNLKAEPDGKAPVREAGEEDIPHLNDVYEKALSEAVYCERDPDAWRLLIDEHKSFGGGFKVWDGGYCAYYYHNGKVIVPEFFSETASPAELAGAFSKECIVTTFGSEKPIAVAKILSKAAEKTFSDACGAYVNLMHN